MVRFQPKELKGKKNEKENKRQDKRKNETIKPRIKR